MAKISFKMAGIAVTSVAAIVIAGCVPAASKENQTTAVITHFDECVDAGYPIWETHPLECRMPDGTVFVQDEGF